jgi:hypothetical protein
VLCLTGASIFPKHTVLNKNPEKYLRNIACCQREKWPLNRYLLRGIYFTYEKMQVKSIATSLDILGESSSSVQQTDFVIVAVKK